MGHTKTICVLIGGAVIFSEIITIRVAIGMSFAVLGMVGYGYFTNKEKQAGGSPEKSTEASPQKSEKMKGADSETSVLLSKVNTPTDSNGVDGPEGGAHLSLVFSL